jgi:hypothetical protein
MTTTHPTPAPIPPVVCAPWCNDGAGHTNEDCPSTGSLGFLVRSENSDNLGAGRILEHPRLAVGEWFGGERQRWLFSRLFEVAQRDVFDMKVAVSPVAWNSKLVSLLDV